ncbi:unnamed protein product, partial [Ectocarpus sp. 12 AP-2014]
ENDPFTLEDIFRGARERARYLEPHMNVVQDFQDSVLDFPDSAARRATGKGNLKACLYTPTLIARPAPTGRSAAGPAHALRCGKPASGARRGRGDQTVPRGAEGAGLRSPHERRL